MSDSLYVHVPFCRSICAYCDFCRVGYQPDLADRYLSELARELQQRFPEQPLKTIYIGGGTPTALNHQQLEKLLRLLQPYTKNISEYTIEINPETVDETKIKLLVHYGINRVSIGVQTFDAALLRLIERRHTPAQIKKVIDQLHQAGIHNISLDLMYGLPQQSLSAFCHDVEKAAALRITHVSLYLLTIEPQAKFGRQHIRPANDELADEMYFNALSRLEQKGFKQYEISNFAKDGYASQHNLAYWHYEDFSGIGLGASGKIGTMRYTNTTNFIKYFNHEYEQETVHNDRKSYLFELLMMGLRLKEGITLNDDTYRDIMELYQEPLNQLVQRGDLIIERNHFKTVGSAYFMLNDILLELLP
ncbi:MAG: radical SAM family heme chaperone HemW [Erysipelotrichaceae bacterium]|nr:radical SAM family heme chaperone HemW [Erysipelotrichaceae bacterium]